MNYFILLWSVFQIYSESTHAQCINTNDPSVPACPAGKTQALDDRYPAAFVTVGSSHHEGLGHSFAMKAFESGKTTKIILSGWKPSAVEDLKVELIKTGYSSKEINQRLIHFEEGTDYQWQQDFVQSEFNPVTGAPEMRPINRYMDTRINIADDQSYFNNLTNKLNNAKLFCETKVSTGKTLPEKVLSNQAGETDSTYFGGNMEGFPGGLCMVGDSLPEESLNDFCKGKPENAIKLPANWLHVGHVDEAFSVVRDLNAKAPCDFAVLRASPKKALDLLKSSLTDPKIGEKKFLDLNEGETTTARIVCNASKSHDQLKNRSNSKPSIEEKKTLKGASILNWFNLISKAHAGSTLMVGKDSCSSLSNREAYDAILFDHEIYDFNMLVEEEMMRGEKEIKAKAAANGCPNVKVIPVPNLFKGKVESELINSDEIITVKLSDGSVLKKKRSEFTEDEMNLIPYQERRTLFKIKIVPREGHAINPNPTNSVMLNQTLIFPEQKNDLFQEYLKKDVAKQLGLKSSFVNTWNSAHLSQGNLHCSTNAFRYCRPVRSSSK